MIPVIHTAEASVKAVRRSLFACMCVAVQPKAYMPGSEEGFSRSSASGAEPSVLRRIDWPVRVCMYRVLQHLLNDHGQLPGLLVMMGEGSMLVGDVGCSGVRVSRRVLASGIVTSRSWRDLELCDNLVCWMILVICYSIIVFLIIWCCNILELCVRTLGALLHAIELEMFQNTWDIWPVWPHLCKILVWLQINENSCNTVFTIMSCLDISSAHSV